MLLWFIVGFVMFYVSYLLAYIFLQPKFIFRPKKLPADFSFTCHAKLQEVNLKTNDGTLLNAALLIHPAHKGMVLYFHGNMHHLQNYLPYTIKFTEFGYSVLMPDYRGYGKSSGTLTQENFYTDALLHYDWMKENFPGQKITVYGRSMGTGAASYVAANRDCDQLILEAPYCNMYDVARWYGLLLPNGKYLPFGLQTDHLLPKVKCRITVLHGNKDRTIPIRSSRKLKPFLKAGDTFVAIEKGTHHNLEQLPKYHEALEKALCE